MGCPKDRPWPHVDLIIIVMAKQTYSAQRQTHKLNYAALQRVNLPIFALKLFLPFIPFSIQQRTVIKLLTCPKEVIKISGPMQQQTQTCNLHRVE